MKELPEKYTPLIRDFIELLKVTFKDNAVSAILFGSVTRGKARKDSDVDMCLIFKSLPRSRHKRTLLIYPIIKALRDRESSRILYNEGYIPEIAPILYTIDELQDTKPIFLDITEDGIILLDDGTLKKKMDETKRRMKELGTHKVVLQNGDYYWVLKPNLHF